MEKITPHTIKKIGFYDSGLGGLFVMSHVVKIFPNYDYVFLADEKNLPYGAKTPEELLVYARKCFSFLIDTQGCDVLVVACNTISATVYQLLAEEYAISHPGVLILDIITPTLDTLPKDTHFSVFATPRTIESGVYQKGIEECFPGSIVDVYPAPDLAYLIEGKQDPREYIASFNTDMYKMSHICILGCTHYGIIEPTFQEIYPACRFVTQHQTIIDLLRFVLHTEEGQEGEITLYTTKENPVLDSYAKDWLKEAPSLIVLPE